MGRTLKKTYNVPKILTDQWAQYEWCHFFDHNGIGWTIAGEHFVWQQFSQRITGDTGLFQLGFGLSLCFASHQSFGLSQKVGQQNFVMFSTGNWILCVGWSNEIAWNQSGTLNIMTIRIFHHWVSMSKKSMRWRSALHHYLMDQLIECMLSICAWFAPNNWTGIEIDTFTSLGNTLAVTFHIALLEIGSETVQILIIWEQGVSLSTVEVWVPNAEQCQNYWSLYQIVEQNFNFFYWSWMLLAHNNLTFCSNGADLKCWSM